jgi:hypothetical protein
MMRVIENESDEKTQEGRLLARLTARTIQGYDGDADTFRLSTVFQDSVYSVVPALERTGRFCDIRVWSDVGMRNTNAESRRHDETQVEVLTNKQARGTRQFIIT